MLNKKKKKPETKNAPIAIGVEMEHRLKLEALDPDSYRGKNIRSYQTH